MTPQRQGANKRDIICCKLYFVSTLEVDHERRCYNSVGIACSNRNFNDSCSLAIAGICNAIRLRVVAYVDTVYTKLLFFGNSDMFCECYSWCLVTNV